MHLCCGSVSKPREIRGCRGPAQKKEERPKCLHMFQASSHLLASIINAAHHTFVVAIAPKLVRFPRSDRERPRAASSALCGKQPGLLFPLLILPFPTFPI